MIEPADRSQAPIDVFIPENWDETATRTLALNMIGRFVNRNTLYGPERNTKVTLREREALSTILQACSWTMLSRIPDAAHPDRRHSILAFRSGKARAGFGEDVLVSPSGSTVDFVLIPVDRKKKQEEDSEIRSNGLQADILQSSDRLYVTLETGHNLLLPLTAQKVRKLRKIRDDLKKEASAFIARNGFMYAVTSSYQNKIVALTGAFDVLIDGIVARATAPKPVTHKNRISKVRRHSDWIASHEEVLGDTDLAMDLGLQHPNRVKEKTRIVWGDGKRNKNKGNQKGRKGFLRSMGRKKQRPYAAFDIPDGLVKELAAVPATPLDDAWWDHQERNWPVIEIGPQRPAAPTLDQITLPADYDHGAILDALPTRRYPLRLASQQDILDSHRSAGLHKNRFFRTARDECCNHLGSMISEAELGRILNSCNIHHVLFTCLGGSNADNNLLLIDRDLHVALHQRTHEIISVLKDCEAEGITNTAFIYGRLRHRPDVHRDEGGNLWVDLPCPEKKYLIPALLVLEERAKLIHLFNNHAKNGSKAPPTP